MATVWEPRGTHQREWATPIDLIAPTGNVVTFTPMTTLRLEYGRNHPQWQGDAQPRWGPEFERRLTYAKMAMGVPTSARCWRRLYAQDIAGRGDARWTHQLRTELGSGVNMGVWSLRVLW